MPTQGEESFRQRACGETNQSPKQSWPRRQRRRSTQSTREAKGRGPSTQSITRKKPTENENGVLPHYGSRQRSRWFLRRWDKQNDFLLCCYFAFVYLAEDVAFSKVDSLTFKRLVQALKKAPYDYRPPTRQKLSGEILDRNAESYAKEQHLRTEMPVCQGFKSHAAGFYCTSIVRQLYVNCTSIIRTYNTRNVRTIHFLLYAKKRI